MNNGVRLQYPYVEHLHHLTSLLDPEAHQTLMIEPELKAEFQCSGCGECCQRPWSVTVSENYYNQWAETLKAHAPGRLDQAFQVYDNATPQRYANINRKPGTHECIFLEDDRRCFIQKHYGEEALSRVCRTYPRYEQWQGVFFGRFMATGCPDIADLLVQFPHLQVQRIQMPVLHWREAEKNPHPLGQNVALTWLGLSLDLAFHEGYTATQNLLRINQVLKWLFSRRHQGVRADHLLQLGAEERARRLPFQEGYQPERFQRWLLHFSAFLPLLKRYVRSVQDRCIAPPVLQPEELTLFNGFMRRYLVYRVLTTRLDPDQPYMGFYKSYFNIAVQMVLLQWLALYYRYRDQTLLTPHHLARAFTQIGYRIEGTRELMDPGREAKMSVPSLLEGIDILLCQDFGRPPAAAAEDS